jgi:hypothetical protein
MGSIIDYMNWRGDLTFETDPFNEADNLILNDVTYAHMENYVRPEERITLGEAAKRYLAGTNDPAFTLGVDSINNIGKTKRFKDIVFYDLEAEVRPGCQFGAVTYELPNDTEYIVFRGTDESIEGWREDFETSYHETAGQTLSYAYLERHIKENGKRYIVGGHSKGGNLAMYASMMLSDEKQDLIEKIYNFDGPGIAPEMLDREKFNRIRSKIVKYVPEYSVVGQLFKLKLKEIIVKSDAKGLLQHNPTKWQIMRNEFVKTDKLDDDCVLINRIFADWIKSTNMKERISFTKVFFDQLKADGGEFIINIKGHTFGESIKMIKNFNSFEEDARRAFKKFILAAARNTAGVSGEKLSNTLNRISDKLKGRKISNKKNG